MEDLTGRCCICEIVFAVVLAVRWRERSCCVLPRWLLVCSRCHTSTGSPCHALAGGTVECSFSLLPSHGYRAIVTLQFA